MKDDNTDTAQKKQGRVAAILRKYNVAILLWVVLFLILAVGYALNLDKQVLAALAVIWGLGTQIFAAAFVLLISYLGALPFLGPLVVKIITLPIFILINGLAFIASLVGVKMGHKRAVFESKVAATILMIGILIGYVLGKIF